MPRLVIAAGGCLETAILPYHVLRLRAQYPELVVQVALSANALNFATPTALQGVSGNTVYTSEVLFDGATQEPIHNVWARTDLLVLYPCTARVLAECALGLISCPVTRLFAFTPKQRVIVTPYLHPDMAEQLYLGHAETLRSVGCTVLEPSHGGLVWGSDSAWMATESMIVSELGLTQRAFPGSLRVTSPGD